MGSEEVPFSSSSPAMANFSALVILWAFLSEIAFALQTHRIGVRMALEVPSWPSRRSTLGQWMVGGGSAVAASTLGPMRSDALGTMPEVATLPRVATHAVVNVAESEVLLEFLTKALGMNVLRSRSTSDGGSVSFLGYGPEELEIPPDFVPGVSNWPDYGAHFSLEVVSKPDAQGDGRLRFFEPGNGLQYIQLGVPQFRISKLLEYGGEIEYAYGYTVVKAPGGLRFQVCLCPHPQARPGPWRGSHIAVTRVSLTSRFVVAGI